MIQAVGKHNCANTLALHAERVEHFVNRVRDLGKLPSEVVITVINVDDVHGALSRTC
jgi:predicted RNA-binding protein with RPS1 domain